VQMRIHVPQFCRGTMNCALPVLLSFVSPGHDASCPYICHFCKTCPRPDRGTRTGSDRVTGIHPLINYPIDFYKFYLFPVLSLQLSDFPPAQIAMHREE